MKQPTIEPGLLSVFRLFTSLRVFFAGLVVLSWLADPERTLYLPQVLDPVLLLLLLLLPWPRLKMERVILPVALAWAGAGPAVLNVSTLKETASGSRSLDIMLTMQVWGSMVAMMLPLVLIAWQYRFRDTVLFSVGVTALAIGVIQHYYGTETLKSNLLMASLAARMFTYIVIGFLITRLMTSQRAQRQALAAANTKLTNYAITLEQLATSRERNRLARELHDTLAHTLSAVAVQLEAVDALWETAPDQARTRFRQSLAMTRSGLTETRRALQALRASPLDDLGLTLALRNLAETTAERGSFALDLRLPPQLDDLPPEVEQAVYRVAQEALENIADHAHARHVSLQLDWNKPTLALRVCDDGGGFSPTAIDPQQSFGLQGLRERAEMLGGTLNVESSAGQGTLIAMVLEVEP